MERRFSTFVALSILLISSCGNPGIYVDVFSGNYSYSRGEYQDANFSYVKAERRKKYPYYVAYNLGKCLLCPGGGCRRLDKWHYSSQFGRQETALFILLQPWECFLFELSKGLRRAFRNRFKEAAPWLIQGASRI